MCKSVKTLTLARCEGKLPRRTKDEMILIILGLKPSRDLR
jgi:hypothetical protein